MRFFPTVLTVLTLLIAGRGVTSAADQTNTDKLAAYLKQHPEADTNRDGLLTMDEAKAHKKGGAAAKPAAGEKGDAPAPAVGDANSAAAAAFIPSKLWDVNGDQAISREEFQAPAKLFENMDTNSDGSLSGAELVKLDSKLDLSKTASTTWNVAPDTSYPGVEHHTYRSDSMQTDVGYNVFLPEGYAASKQRYPVIYHLHGSGGNENSQTDLSVVYREAIAAGKLPPVIVVFVNGGRRSYYSDSADGKVLSETTIIRELIPHIDATYRTLSDRNCRVLHGFSMGGYGALKLGLKFPELFGTVISFCGGMAAPGTVHLTFLKHIVGDTPEALAANNPADIVRTKKESLKDTTLWLFTGTRDVALEDSTWAHHHLEALGIPHRFEISPDTGHQVKRHFELHGEDLFAMLRGQFEASPAFQAKKAAAAK